MASSEILIRLSLSLIFSGLIGYEREVSESNAGLNTHFSWYWIHNRVINAIAIGQ